MLGFGWVVYLRARIRPGAIRCGALQAGGAAIGKNTIVASSAGGEIVAGCVVVGIQNRPARGQRDRGNSGCDASRAGVGCAGCHGGCRGRGFVGEHVLRAVR